MSYFTQMAGLAYHNFVSAAVGISVAIAFIRGIAQKEKDTLGNFWVDMVRASLWVLLPISIVGALFLVSQGVVQNLKPYDKVAVVDPQTVTTTGATGSRRRPWSRADDRAGAGGLAGDHQAVRHQRRRLLQRQQRASVRESDAAHELPGDVRHLRDLVRPHLHARLDDRIARGTAGRSGRAMAFLFLAGVTVAYWAEARGNPMLTAAGADQTVTAMSPGGNMEGQGGPVRHRQHGALRHRDHRRELRRDQRLARLVHAARRPGAAGEHAVERSRLRRRRRRHVRRAGLHHPVGVHRRA